MGKRQRRHYQVLEREKSKDHLTKHFLKSKTGRRERRKREHRGVIGALFCLDLLQAVSVIQGKPGWLRSG